MLITPNGKRFFLVRFDGPSFDGILIYPYNGQRNIKTREAVTHSQRLCITPRYLATGNSFEDS